MSSICFAEIRHAKTKYTAPAATRLSQAARVYENTNATVSRAHSPT